MGVFLLGVLGEPLLLPWAVDLWYRDGCVERLLRRRSESFARGLGQGRKLRARANPGPRDPLEPVSHGGVASGIWNAAILRMKTRILVEPRGKAQVQSERVQRR